MNLMPHRMDSWLGMLVAAGLSSVVSLPSADAETAPPQSQIVDSIAGQPPVLEVRKPAVSAHRAPRHVYRVHRRVRGLALDRPALAGVLLVEPIPGPFKAPRPIVPTPAYFVDGVGSAFTTPPPPIVCERRRRDPSLPDPRLYREVPLVCGYDID